MADFIFRGIFDTEHTAVITPGAFVLCVGVSLLIGLLLCAMTLWRAKSSGSFAVTLALLPAVVCVVIMMVNGNVGTGGMGGGKMPGGSRDGARPDHAPQDGDLPQPPDGDPPRPVAGASGQTA